MQHTPAIDRQFDAPPAVHGEILSVLDQEKRRRSVKGFGQSHVDRDHLPVEARHHGELRSVADHDVLHLVRRQNPGEQRRHSPIVLRQLSHAAIPQRTLIIGDHALGELGEIGQLFPDLGIDFAAGRCGVLLADSSVKENRIIDLDDGVLLAQPLSIFAVGLKRQTMLHPSQRVLVLKLLAPRGFVRGRRRPDA